MVKAQLATLARLGNRTLLRATQIFIIIVLTWYALRLYPGDDWLPVSLGNYIVVWFFVGLIPALGVAILKRRPWLIGGALVGLLLFTGYYGHLFTTRPAPASASGNGLQLKMLTFNVHYSNRNAQQIVDLIHAEQPDVIALQELTGPLAKLLLPKLTPNYPYVVVENSYPRAPALLSRYPLQAQPTPPEVWRSQKALLKLPGTTVTIWNVHPRPAAKPDGLQIQTETLTAVAKAIQSESGPLIVLGDFNATDYATNYRRIAAHLTEVHQAVGRGFGLTYPEPDVVAARIPPLAGLSPLVVPFARLDHIFVSRHFGPQQTHVIPNGFGSDHRPVVAALRLVDW